MPAQLPSAENTPRGLSLLIALGTFPAFFASAAVAFFTAALAVTYTVDAARALADGDLNGAVLKTDYISIVSLTLTAMVFFLIGIGIFVLYVRPGSTLLGPPVHSLADLEVKVTNVIAVILLTKFLERFVEVGVEGSTLLYEAAAVALALAAIIAFQLVLRGKETA